MRSPSTSTLAISAAITCLLLGFCVNSSAGESQNFITYDKTTQRFTAAVDDQPFEWVVEKLENAADIEFTVFKDDYATVTATFENLPLDKTIGALLRDTSHIVSTGDTVNIFVLSREDEDSASVDTRAETDSNRLVSEQETLHTSGTAQTYGVTENDKEMLKDFKHYLIDSLPDTPDMQQLRAELEKMPAIELTDEENRLLQNPSEAHITDLLLNNLLQVGTQQPARHQIGTDRSSPDGG